MQQNQVLEQALAQVRHRRSLPAPVKRRWLRIRAGLSQAVVAESLGCTSATISRYEAGTRSPQRDMLERYARVLERLTRAGSGGPR